MASSAAQRQSILKSKLFLFLMKQISTFLLLLCAAFLQAQTIYVKQNASGANDGKATAPTAGKTEWKEGPEDMYDFRAEPPAPLTPYHLMTEVEERVDFRGQVLTPLNEDDVRRAVRCLLAQDVSTVAVTLLHSHANPAHERRVAQIVAEMAPQMARPSWLS